VDGPHKGREVAHPVSVRCIRNRGTERFRQGLAADCYRHILPFRDPVKLFIASKEIDAVFQVRDRHPQQPRAKFAHRLGQARQRRVGTEIDGLPTGVKQDELSQERRQQIGVAFGRPANGDRPIAFCPRFYYPEL
jgi:hypothetical protein